MRTPWLARMLAVSATVSGLAIAGPVVALADPPAVGAPIAPGPFVGAPTTQNQYGGEEDVNFTSTGKFIGVGRAPEHYSNFDLGQRSVKQQARIRNASRIERKIVNDQFASFAEQLQTIAKDR